MNKNFGGSVKAIIFCGYHDTGKTTLMAKAAAGLRGRGWKVCAVKHMGSDRYVLDETNDTGILLQAGCNEVIALTESFTVHYRHVRSLKPAERLHELLRLFEADYVLIEGFKSYTGVIPKIVFGHTREQILSLIDASAVAYSGIGIEDFGFPHMRFISPGTDPNTVAEFIETHTCLFSP